jgi:hypothetical protein
MPERVQELTEVHANILELRTENNAQAAKICVLEAEGAAFSIHSNTGFD